MILSQVKMNICLCTYDHTCCKLQFLEVLVTFELMDTVIWVNPGHICPKKGFPVAVLISTPSLLSSKL